MALDYLASHVADIPSWFQFILETEHFHLPADFKYEVKGTREELLDYFDKNAQIGREWIAKVSDEEMAKDWKFSYGDIFTMTQPRVEAVRETINHMIHHRAQLGVYLRLQNVPIPGMYGPSADDVWK